MSRNFLTWIFVICELWHYIMRTIWSLVHSWSNATRQLASGVRTSGAKSAETQWRRITRESFSDFFDSPWSPGLSGNRNERQTNTRYLCRSCLYLARRRYKMADARMREKVTDTEGQCRRLRYTAVRRSPDLHLYRRSANNASNVIWLA